MSQRLSTRNAIGPTLVRWALAVAWCAVLLLPAGANAQWLPATGDGVDLWIARPTTEEVASLRILHRRDLEEPANRIYRAGTLTGRLAPGGLACAGDRLWLVYDNLAVQSLPVTISDRPDRERYGGPVAERSLPSPAKLWSFAANQAGPWALVRLESQRALDSLTPPEEVAATAPATQPTTVSSRRAAAVGGAVAAPATSAAEPATQPFKPVDALLRLKRNRWTPTPLPEDWSPDGRNFLLMLRATDTDPVLVSLRPDHDAAPAGTLAVVYRMGPEGWHKRVYNLPGGQAEPAGETVPLAIDGQLVVASLSFTPAPATQPSAAPATQPAVGEKAAPQQGTLTLEMAILGDSVASITPLLLAQNKPASYALVPVRQSLSILLADEEGNLSWGVVDLHGKPEGAIAALLPRDEQVLFEQSVWLVPVLLLAGAVLIMFARMRQDSPAATPKFPQGFVAADFLRRTLAFFLDLAPCVFLTTAIFGTEAPVLIGKWAHFNVGWDVMLPRLVVVGLFALHTGLSELFTGKSFGKSVLGLKVISTSGQPPSFMQILVRNLLKVFDLIAWPLLFLPLIRPHGQRLGDLAAKTVVVMPEPEEEDEDDSDDPI